MNSTFKIVRDASLLIAVTVLAVAGNVALLMM